jgi:hypothetical protein
MNNNNYNNKYKRCLEIVRKTNKRCKAPSVLPNTFRTITSKDKNGKKKIIRTSIVNIPHYCQMHQPDSPVKFNFKCHKNKSNVEKNKVI